MRSILLAAMTVLPLLAILNLARSTTSLRAFQRQVPALRSTHDVERFKELAAQQMYAALLQIGLLGLPVVILLVGVAGKILLPADALLFLLVPSLVILVVASRLRGLERAVKSTPAADDELARQRDAVVTTWMKKAVPDW